MKNKYTWLSINVVLIFLTGMVMSMVPDLFPDLFGDWICEGCVRIDRGAFFEYKGCDFGPQDSHSPTWHWGYRHWLFFIMGIILFIIQVGRVIQIIDKEEK